MLQTIIRILDTLTECLGRATAWLTLAMVLLTALVVILRYLFNTGSIALQEGVIYLHASVFMLSMGYALKHRQQVRVDILYRRFTRVKKAWVDSLGALILLTPLCLFILIGSWGFVESSWRIQETSAEPGGIPAVFLLKSIIPLAAIALLMAAIAEFLRDLLTLMNADTSTDGSSAGQSLASKSKQLEGKL